MAEFRIDQEDAILPVRITHNSEQIWNGDTLEQNYNYLVYEFETEQHRYRARTYLNTIRTVAVYGPFAKDSNSLHPWTGSRWISGCSPIFAAVTWRSKRSVQPAMCRSSESTEPAEN